MTKKLWRTTIVILSDYNPTQSDLEELAHSAISGDAYLYSMDNEAFDPDQEGNSMDEDSIREFFNLDPEEDEDDPIHN
jgi:hypothetical protein